LFLTAIIIVSLVHMSTHFKLTDPTDKENSQVVKPVRKEKQGEEPQIKKKILGETSQPQSIVEEPSSPEGSRLLARKREFQRQQRRIGDFAFRLFPC